MGEGAGKTGFSLIELAVAMGLSLMVLAATFAVIGPLRARFEADTEASDVDQRLRVAAEALSGDLAMAGAGAYLGPGAGRLVQYFAPVLPYGPAQPVASVQSDLVWLVYVPDAAPQTTIANALPAANGSVVLSADAGCAVGVLDCGFVMGMTVLVFDSTGAWDLFLVDGVGGATLSLHHLLADSSKVFAAGSRIAQAVSRSYFLEADDAATGGGQLVRQDTGASAVPIADHVVDLAFAYYGDAHAPRFLETMAPAEDPWSRRSTYGPSPQASGTAATTYPPGENCTFEADAATGQPVPRLVELTAAGSAELVPLAPSVFTDGPWCPDATADNRFDADLLRIRMVTVTVRVESALASLRGPAGILFSRGGTATAGGALVPDRVVRLDIAPRNLAVPR